MPKIRVNQDAVITWKDINYTGGQTVDIPEKELKNFQGKFQKLEAKPSKPLSVKNFKKEDK